MSNTIEPTVIDEELLKKAVNDQIPIEIAEVARKEGIDPLEVLALRLDYKSIYLHSFLFLYLYDLE